MLGILINHLLDGKMEFMNRAPNFPGVLFLHPMAGGFIWHGNPEIALLQRDEYGSSQPVLESFVCDSSSDAFFNLFPRIHASIRNKRTTFPQTVEKWQL